MYKRKKPLSPDRQSDLKKLGENVRRIRKAKSLSLQRMADQSRLTPKHIHRIEKGETNITLMTILHLAEALGIHHCELVDFNFDSSKPKKKS